MAYEDLYVPRWSAPILSEVQRTLVRDGMASSASAARLVATMSQAFPNAAVPSDAIEPLIGSMTNHWKDRHVLATAVASRADLIVTFNLKDFPERALAPYGVWAIHPDNFLIQRLAAAQHSVLTLLREQAADLINPPVTVDQVLDNLALHAPAFAALAREALHAAD